MRHATASSRGFIIQAKECQNERSPSHCRSAGVRLITVESEVASQGWAPGWYIRVSTNFQTDGAIVKRCGWWVWAAAPAAPSPNRDNQRPICRQSRADGLDERLDRPLELLGQVPLNRRILNSAPRVSDLAQCVALRRSSVTGRRSRKHRRICPRRARGFADIGLSIGRPALSKQRNSSRTQSHSQRRPSTYGGGTSYHDRLPRRRSERAAAATSVSGRKRLR